MPIKESDNKSITTSTISSTDNIENIKVNEVTSAITDSLNNIANNIENYNLNEPELGKEGVLNRDDLDFSRIANTAGNAKEGNFVNVKNPRYWGDNAPLTYKIRDDGTVAISEDGVILGFTDLQGIRIKEADSSKEEQIITTTSNITSEQVAEEVTDSIQESKESKEVEAIEETEEVKEDPVEIKEEQEEVVQSEEKQPEEIKTEVLEEVVQPQVEQQTEVLETPQSSNETSSNTIAIPGNVRQTGIIKNNTNYSYFYGKWNKGTGQERVAEMWNEAGRQQSNGIATLNGRYLVAVSPIFGLSGDIIDVVLDDGTVIPCIIGDAKGSDATSQYGHMFGSSVDVIEWESYGSKEDIVIDQWEGKNVVQIVNKGSILTN